MSQLHIKFHKDQLNGLLVVPNYMSIDLNTITSNYPNYNDTLHLHIKKYQINARSIRCTTDRQTNE